MPVNFLKNLFFSAKDEVEAVPHKIKTLTESASYELAFLDTSFLLREELRPVRLQLELLKPEMLQQEQGIEATLAVFGSARIPDRSKALIDLEEARRALEADPENEDLATKLRVAESMLAKSYYYEQAQRFGRIIASKRKDDPNCPFVIVSGGGPGIMEGANRGVHEAGGKSIGLKISLPMEDEPNPYVTPELCFQFHYFALRKMHFLMRAKAIVAFPGGFGTLDEVFESLTLIQTGKIHKVPFLLFGEKYWKKIINFDALLEEGVISQEDLNLFHYVETAEEAWEGIARFYGIF